MTRRRVLAFSLAVGSLVTGWHGIRRGAQAQPHQAQAQSLRYYVAVRGVIDPNGEQGGSVEDLRELFVDQLRRRPDTTTTQPSWLPTGAAQMRAELASHRVKAYEAYLKVRDLDERVVPLLEDPTRRRVTVEIDVQVVGSTMPDRILKIGGEGSASSTIVIGPSVDATAVVRRMRREVAAEAIRAALINTEEKIQLVAMRDR